MRDYIQAFGLCLHLRIHIHTNLNCQGSFKFYEILTRELHKWCQAPLSQFFIKKAIEGNLALHNICISATTSNLI